jgi:acyl-CoA reductase-like NAD-dependent aldehyde dehydrogenase
MGPLHAPSQKAFVDTLIAEAKASGADVREFAELPGGDLAGGNFVRPALVINPDPTLRVVVEEQFGPVIPLIPFTTEAEAVAAANNTWAGLGGSVWSASPEAAHRVGSQLACGYVWVNDHGAARLDLRAPFGGMKESGFGREQGIEGIRAFQDTRAIATIDAAALAAQAH